MAEKPKQKLKLECPLSKEQREAIKELGDVVEKHRKIVKKFTG
jgi:hypothetical protein